jgi:hypothetical protein
MFHEVGNRWIANAQIAAFTVIKPGGPCLVHFNVADPEGRTADNDNTGLVTLAVDKAAGSKILTRIKGENVADARDRRSA